MTNPTRSKPALALVPPAQKPPAKTPAPSVWQRWRARRRPPPSTFHRCLAVHLHYAQRASALD